ncbi:MAG: integrase arm-type DNA-binding domain-containing protein [Bauldia sp.]
MAKTLTVRQIAALTEPGKYRAGRNLLLQISSSKTKAWIFRYTRNGKTQDMGLGRLDDVSLAKANADAHRYRQLLADNKDPITERRIERQQVAPKTFREFAKEFVKRQRAGWRNPKTATQFIKTLERHAFDTIGDLPVHEVNTDHLVKILEPIWSTIPVMADHVRTNIAVVLDAAKAKHLRHGDNPARWAGTLEHLFPRKGKVRKPKHHAALDYKAVPEFMKALRQRHTIAGRALEFTILTAARTNETILARWPDIDVKTKTWTVPAERMKNGEPHRVPLSSRALAILSKLPREAGNEYVFVGTRYALGLSNMAMLKLIWKLKPGATVHGFRAAFRGWATVVAKARHEVAEAALSHLVGDKTVRAYQREDFLDERRELMAGWDQFCASKS